MAPAIPRRRPVAVTATIATLALALVSFVVVATGSAQAAGPLISQGRPATASSAENATMAAANAVDGNPGTRWSSAFGDPQWIQVDLGQTAAIDQVTLSWEAAYAPFVPDPDLGQRSSWTTVYSTTTGAGGTQTLAVSGSGRYVRMYGTARGTPYGYSLWEFGVYGVIGGGTGCGGANVAQAARRARRPPRTHHRPRERGRRQCRHPLVERVQSIHSGSRSTSAPPSRSARSC